MSEQRLVDGYRTQADLLSVACEGVVHRALHERVSLILEGVHVSPQLLQRIEVPSDAVVVPVMLGVLNSDSLKARIKGRGQLAPGRRSKRYLKHFDSIWSLQSHLLSEADQSQMTIVPNESMESTVEQILSTIIDQLQGENGRDKKSK